MKVKDYLKTSQPVFYRLIERSFTKKEIPHAYLLVGTNSDQAATYLAQSLICEQESLACEECNECRRVAEHNYPDYMDFDGREESLKKKDILHIQTRFSETSFEGGAKVYVLRQIDNASSVAMNALLKFLEEPVDGVYAILTTSNLNKVLPTIQSRCQIVTMLPDSPESIRMALINEGIEAEDASIVSRLKGSVEGAKEVALSEEYMKCKVWALNYIEDLYQAPGNLLINMQIHLTKEYGKDKRVMRLFLEILELGIRDMFHVKHHLTPAFTDHEDFFRNLPDDDLLEDRIEIVADTLYFMDTNAIGALLLDAMTYKILKGVKYRG